MKRTLILLIALLPLTGCSIAKRIAKTSSDVEAVFASAKEWEQLPLRTISWNQAISMIRNNNRELKKLNSQIERCERNEMSIYTDMIPGVSFYGYFTSSINDMVKNVSGSDVSSNVNVTFNVPTLTAVPYRVYAAKATTFAIMKNKEGKERELFASLYGKVRNREVDLKLRSLKSDVPDTSDMERMLAANANRQADATYWKQVAELLGDYTARWQILPSSLPRVTMGVYSSRLKKMDPLTVCRFALQIERARMAQYGIAMQYLPTVNASLYSPSLFTSSGGTYSGTFLSGEDTRINLSTSYRFDTQLDIWNSYKDRKAEYENTRLEVAAAVMEHKHKLTQLRRSMQDYFSWRSYMQKRLEYTKSLPVTTADEQIARDKGILDMKRELLSQEKTAIESEVALLVEYGMP